MTAPRSALELPLTGVRVVEASAGTGKTFTLATLYLRLVLEQALTPEQIVVATFTRAAAGELATRLRQRLRLAAALLAQDQPERARAGEDGQTGITRQAIEQALQRTGNDVAALRGRARAAELAMDTATIGTLHSFCNRVLGEFGFETGRALTALELFDDLRALQQEVIDDFWRTRAVDAESARLLSETWGSPQKLAAQATDPRWRGREVVADDAIKTSAQQAQVQRADSLAHLEAIRNTIAGWDPTLLAAAEAELADCIGHKAARDNRIRGLHHLHAWAKAERAPTPLPAAVQKALGELAAEAMRGMKTCRRLPQGPVFAAATDLADAASTLEKIDGVACARLLLQAREFLDRELPARMKALGKLGHDQAIDALAAALDDPARGAQAVEAIRQRWPVALVDEFQDTDPAQWRILKTLFAHDAGALVLVGDPKQAIYGFRGGDVHAYLAARACADGEPMPLEISQRAGVAVNGAINALFSRTGAFVETAITHPDVHSAQRVAQRALLLDGKPSPGLQLWRVPAGVDARGKPKKRNKGDAQRAIQSACVARIVELLAAARAGTAQLRGGDGSVRALQAGDIAVLVNDNRQAHSMQHALALAGVPAASCLRASVYASEEAVDLRLLLEALRDPADVRRARAAQASLLVGADAESIAHTLDDATALDVLLERTRAWAVQAEQRGPLALMHALIAQAAPRLLATPGGERRVANYLQLAELLQQQADACFGLDDLCRQYARQLMDDSSDVDGDATRLRLETDAHAVQIATLHAAKGLEYGVVFLPYAALGREPANKGRLPVLTWHHQGDQARVAIGNEVAPEIAIEALDEIRAEEVRRFYVGVTRACATCVLPWGWINLGQHTAARWLLQAAGRDEPLPFDDSGCEQALQELAARAPRAIAIEPLPDTTRKRLAQPEEEARELRARGFAGAIERDWRTWSFSRLIRGEGRSADADPRPGSGDEAAPADVAPIITLPSAAPILAGTRFGTAVHAALERADFAAWRDAGGIPDSERALLARSLRAQGLPNAGTMSIDTAIGIVGDCLRGALNVALPCGVRLCDLAPDRRRAELEFHLRLAPTQVGELFALLHTHGYQRGRSGVGRDKLHGLLTGVIDLVFEHDGRYHLIDYKTNLLPAYAQDSLDAAIQAHDYDLQYLLYTLALHRWLGQVLPGYDYDTHLGEVYYLFVRDLAEGRGIHRDRPPRMLVETMDALFDARLDAAA